jgi:hypothetical protein
VPCHYLDFVCCLYKITTTTTTTTTTAIGLSPSGSSPALVQTKVKILKTTKQNKKTQNKITTKQ